MPDKLIENDSPHMWGKFYILPTGDVVCALCGAAGAVQHQVLRNSDGDIIGSRPFVKCSNRACEQSHYSYYFPLTTLRTTPEYRKASDAPAQG